MSIYEFAERMRKMQQLMVPNYVSQLQEITQKFQMQNQGITKVLSEFQKHYQPIQLNAPQFEIPKIPTSQFAENSQKTSNINSRLVCF